MYLWQKLITVQSNNNKTKEDMFYKWMHLAMNEKTLSQ